MKKTFLTTLALVILTATLSVVAAAQDVFAEREWHRYSPPNSGFSVLMPGKVTTQEQKLDSAQGERINHVFHSDLDGDVFMVTYLQLPDPVTDPEAIKVMLNSGRDRGLESSKGKLDRETEITLDGNLGREWLITLPNNLKVKAKAYWVSQKLFQVLVIMDAVKTPEVAKRTDERMEKFFNSFNLVKTAN